MTGWNTIITIELYGGRVDKPPGIRWSATRPCTSKQRVNDKGSHTKHQERTKTVKITDRPSNGTSLQKEKDIIVVSS
jgi:hypothetical protein